MSFIRIKKIKKKSGNSYEYAYLVESKWYKRGKKGARQKVKGFLGRVYRPEIKNNKTFFEHLSIDNLDIYVNGKTISDIAKDLIMWEFFKHGVSNDFIVDFDQRVLRRYNNKAVVKMNEGFLCDYTLKKLIGFNFKDDEHAGMSLAKAFVEAGINIPKELFVKVFEKMS